MEAKKLMPKVTRTQLLDLLTRLSIKHETVDHPAFYTVEEGRAFKQSMPGGHSKNLFLKDKKGNLALATAWADTKVDLVGLGKRLGAKGRYSFADAEKMERVLGVSPGSVTPFAVINASPDILGKMVVDEALMRHERIWFHPMENTASTAISPKALLTFIEHAGFQPAIIDLSSPMSADGQKDV